jgi:hypothetical protein
MINPVPDNWLDGTPNGVVLHWTGGTNRANTTDKRHYHFLIEGDGTIRRGSFTVSDNDDTSDQEYAAHTRNFNTRRVGVALCGMKDAIERPYIPGPYPINQTQWRVLIDLCAQMAVHYHWDINERTFTMHSRVQAVHGVAQLGKWDISVLPWDTALTQDVIVHHLLSGIEAVFSQRWGYGEIPEPDSFDRLFKMLPTVNVEDILAPIYNQGSVLSLREFQRAHGLVPDAVIGPRTWAALFKLMDEGE